MIAPVSPIRIGGQLAAMIMILALPLLASGCAIGRTARPLVEQPLLVDNMIDEHLQRTPVIDVHAHTFNATMLPIEGIALGKRDMFWFLSLLNDRTARCVATYVSSLAHWNEILINPVEADRRALGWTSERTGVSLPSLRSNMVMRAIRRAYFERCDEHELAERVCPNPEAARDQLAGFARSNFQLDVETGFEEFMATLLTPRAEVPASYLAGFKNHPELQERHRRGLLVSHMLDLGPVHNQRPTDNGMIDYESQQVPATSAQQDSMNGWMIYFVGYSPFRDHWPHEDPGDALAIVQDAIERHGAYGVKFYPPSGYRAINNEIPGPPNALFTKFPNRQWEARYTRFGHPTDKGRLVRLKARELDCRIAALLEYCEDNDIPVFAHCNTGEFEARNGYGIQNSDPEFWKAYLESRSTPGNPCKLRLCLGHAGGSAFWFGNRGHDASDQHRWGEVVYELCTTYPNVYCEIGVHGQVRREEYREHFIETLLELFERSSSDPNRLSFRTKVMYGSDWFMPSGLTLVNYFDAYEYAFLDPCLRDSYRDFFLNNALRFLNAQARQHDPRLPQTVRSRLRDLVTVSDL